MDLNSNHQNVSILIGLCVIWWSNCRIANLIGKWLINGRCRETIFNLKLPMKKRYQEVMLCLENLAVMLAEKELEFDIQAKHLYHDREEITVHIALK